MASTQTLENKNKSNRLKIYLRPAEQLGIKLGVRQLLFN